MTYTTPSRIRTACRQLWGEPDKQYTLAPGVVAFSTPGHGGIIVSTELFELDPRLKNGLFSGPIEWTRNGEVVLSLVGFEEDCDWGALIYLHPELALPAAQKGYFSVGVEEILAYAKRTVEAYHPTLLNPARANHSVVTPQLELV